MSLSSRPSSTPQKASRSKRPYKSSEYVVDDDDDEDGNEVDVSMEEVEFPASSHPEKVWSAKLDAGDLFSGLKISPEAKRPASKEPEAGNRPKVDPLVLPSASTIPSRGLSRSIPKSYTSARIASDVEKQKDALAEKALNPQAGSSVHKRKLFDMIPPPHHPTSFTNRPPASRSPSWNMDSIESIRTCTGFLEEHIASLTWIQDCLIYHHKTLIRTRNLTLAMVDAIGRVTYIQKAHQDILEVVEGGRGGNTPRVASGLSALPLEDFLPGQPFPPHYEPGPPPQQQDMQNKIQVLPQPPLSNSPPPSIITPQGNSGSSFGRFHVVQREKRKEDDPPPPPPPPVNPNHTVDLGLNTFIPHGEGGRAGCVERLLAMAYLEGTPESEFDGVFRRDYLGFGPDFYRTIANPGGAVPDAIPLELWIDIVDDLEPIDVLRLSQTCRFFHDILCTHDIWTRILRSICRRYQLFEPSYPMNDMDVSHLQRVALGPHLWANLVKRHAVTPVYLTPASRPITPVSTLTMNDTPSEGSYFLIPGGRFLVILRNPNPGMNISDNTDPYTLELWDLGVVGTSPRSAPILLGKTDTGVASPNGSRLFIGEEGSTTLTAVVDSVEYPSVQSGINVFIAKFDGEENKIPEFKPVARLVLPRVDHGYYWNVAALYQNRVLLETGRELHMVWDFVNNTYTAFHFSEPTDLPNWLQPLHFDGDMFAAMSDGRYSERMIMLYKIPELTGIPSSSEAPFPCWTRVAETPTYCLPPKSLTRSGYLIASRGRSLILLPLLQDETYIPIVNGRISKVGGSITRYIFTLEDGNKGQPSISYKAIAQASLDDPSRMELAPASIRSECISSSFFSSSMLQLDLLSLNTTIYIYSIVPNAHLPAKERLGKDKDTAICPATLMLTPLFGNRGFDGSCIASGRLLYSSAQRTAQVMVEDYLWAAGFLRWEEETEPVASENPLTETNILKTIPASEIVGASKSSPSTEQSVMHLTLKLRHLKPGSTVQVGAIPLELWIDVVGDLEPIDVLRLSQTCSFLYKVLWTHDIWTRILRSICRRYQLFEPSYPMDDMDIPHLQRVALGPHLWANLVKRHAVTPEDLTPESKPIMPVSTISSNLGGSRSPLFLVPGGRFLVVTNDCDPSSDSPLILELWDLGLAGISHSSTPALVGVTNTGVTELNGAWIFVGDGTSATLTAVVQSSDFDSMQDTINIFTAKFHGGQNNIGSFELLSRMTLPQESQGDCWYAAAFHQNRLLLQAENRRFVWDIVNNTYTCFRYEALHRIPSYTAPMHFDGDSYAAIIHWPDAVVCCKFPELKAIPSGPGATALRWTEITDVSSSPLPVQQGTKLTGPLFPATGRSFTQLPLFQDVATASLGMGVRGTLDAITRYEFTLVKGIDEQPDIVTCTPCMQAEIHKGTEVMTFVSMPDYKDRSKKSKLSLFYDTWKQPLEENGMKKKDTAICPATLMLTPLGTDRALEASCIASGRLLYHSPGSPEQFILEDYLW
ncbi:hypothetical protein NMY22_g10418 [Coprinellus aureogranulatus]|nr:hypothetical protein NMY22_g10418 [Coprinellus aureogranulatus]